MKLFNKPWMQSLNPGLLRRYWQFKGSPDALKVDAYGMAILHVMTPFGIFMYIG